MHLFIHLSLALFHALELRKVGIFFTHWVCRPGRHEKNWDHFLITFSYGRGLQASALKEFGNNQENVENIQKAFNHRAKMNGLSTKGEWSENLEKEFAA